jgi:nicotinate dehydrogenase subunit A
LLEANAGPTEDEIRRHMMPNLCRCGTHMRIIRAVQRAAQAMKSVGNAPAANVTSAK